MEFQRAETTLPKRSWIYGSDEGRCPKKTWDSPTLTYHILIAPRSLSGLRTDSEAMAKSSGSGIRGERWRWRTCRRRL